MKKLYFKYFLFLVLFVSCNSVEPVDETIAKTEAQTTLVNTRGDYWPTAVNNKWQYLFNTTVVEPRKIVSVTNLNNSIIAVYLPTTSFFNSIYYETISRQLRKQNGNYYSKIGSIQSGNPTDLVTTTKISERLDLKHNLPVGGTWESDLIEIDSYSNPNFESRTSYHFCKFKILAKDVSENINGVTYHNIIKVKMVSNVLLPDDTWDYTLTIETWYARNIGPIKKIYNKNNLNFVEIITNYDLY